jgi:hypothetical protein
MKEAHKQKHEINGLKGLSPMVALEYFDLTYGFVLDYMHAALIGVMKFLMDLWFDSNNFMEEFYLGKFFSKMQEDLLRMMRPKNLTRPLNLGDYKQWKASQFRAFLLVFGYPVLKKYMKKQYLSNFLHLSNGIFLLCKETISAEDLQASATAISKFHESFEVCYGLKNMRFNVHLISHLPHCVKRMGNLWCYSMFVFESNNGFIGRILSGTRNVVKEISKKYSVIFKYFSTKDSSDSKYRQLGQVFIPKWKKRSFSIPDQLQQFVLPQSSVETIKYFIWNHYYFESQSQKKTADCFFQLTDKSIATIKEIFVVDGEIFLYIDNSNRFVKTRFHFSIVKPIKEDKKIVRVHDIQRKISFMLSEMCYSYFPNSIEGD